MIIDQAYEQKNCQSDDGAVCLSLFPTGWMMIDSSGQDNFSIEASIHKNQ